MYLVVSLHALMSYIHRPTAFANPYSNFIHMIIGANDLRNQSYLENEVQSNLIIISINLI